MCNIALIQDAKDRLFVVSAGRDSKEGLSAEPQAHRPRSAIRWTLFGALLEAGSNAIAMSSMPKKDGLTQFSNPIRTRVFSRCVTGNDSGRPLLTFKHTSLSRLSATEAIKRLGPKRRRCTPTLRSVKAPARQDLADLSMVLDVLGEARFGGMSNLILAVFRSRKEVVGEADKQSVAARIEMAQSVI
jgi:hypothetical protein